MTNKTSCRPMTAVSGVSVKSAGIRSHGHNPLIAGRIPAHSRKEAANSPNQKRCKVVVYFLTVKTYCVIWVTALAALIVPPPRLENTQLTE